MAKPQKSKKLSPFNIRVREARAHAKLTQEQLATSTKLGQGGVDKLENRWAEGSVKTVQIAAACGVNPYWLATGEGAMLTDDLPPQAAAIGAAWSAIKGWTKDRFAHDLLEVGLPFMPPKHPLYKVAEKLFRESLKKTEIGKELAGQT